MDLIRIAWERFHTNLLASFELMTLQKWIRVVIIVGTYMLLRPYLIALGKKSQMRSHEAAENENTAEISPNELRGQVDIPDPDESGDEDTAEASGPNWGKQARKRQRKFLKDMIEAEEKKLQESKEEEEDKDIEEFLMKE